MNKIKFIAELGERAYRSGHVEMSQDNLSATHLVNLFVKFAKSLGFLNSAIRQAMKQELDGTQLRETEEAVRLKGEVNLEDDI